MIWRLTVLTLTYVLLQGHKDLVEQGDALRAAADALNADRITTLRFVASGANFTVGQNFTRNDPWPRVAIKSYTASIDYKSGSMRLELWREMGPTMPRGGGVPFPGDLHQIQVVSGGVAQSAKILTGRSKISLLTLFSGILSLRNLAAMEFKRYFLCRMARNTAREMVIWLVWSYASSASARAGTELSTRYAMLLP